ncbi:uncharacterized protein [Hetaerina americana]|uniref:uncharacterized protein n=1 Tax=Hetaerina americana TaxID=62018 RepID=UPI003A7F3C21
MERFFRIYYIAALITCCSSTAKGNIFGKGLEATYSYTADVRAGTNDPAYYASQFGLLGTLTIQSNSDGSSASFKMNNITMQAYNGPLSPDEYMDTKFLQAPPESAILEEPFEVLYKDGLVQVILSNDNEEESLWALNIKKSIATIFQLDMKKLHLDKSNSFHSEEKSIYGHKRTENIILVNEKGRATLRKMLVPLIPPSNENVYHKWINLDGIQCSHQHQDTFDSPSKRSYDFKTSGGSIVIENVTAHGQVTFSPYSEGGFTQYIKVVQEFKLIMQTQMKYEYRTNPGKEHNPVCNYAGFDEKLGTRLNSAGEQGQPKKDNLIPIVQKHLQKLIDILDEVNVGGHEDEDSFMEKKKEQNHFASSWLMKILEYADYESLKNCFSQIGVGTSYKEETMRDLFLDVLSQVGTKASITLLTDLIVSQSLKDESSVQVLKTIPFYARQLDASLLEKYESVLGIDHNDQIKRAATLSFATLVNRACKHDRCPAEVLEKYVLKYYELFKDATEYQWQMNYLEGLSNIEVGKVVEYLEPIIKGDQPHSHHIRFLAMWATRFQGSERVEEVYWPILIDKMQHLELRVGAFVILLLSKPTQDRFNSIAAVMEEEIEGSYLYYFFYSTMQSLAGTKHPCYQIMKKPAQNILQYAKTPKTLLWTGNHISDYIDPDNHFGGLLQLFMVANPNTGGPNVLYFLHNDHFLGHSRNMFSFYIKIRGIRSPNLELQSYADKDKLGNLQQLLSSFDVGDVEDEPVHVELIIQFQDRAIMTHYYNETNYSEMFLTLKTMSSGFGSAFHLNYQRLLFPLINEITGPTDLGVPMALRIPIPFMFSLRGNFTVDVADKKIIRKVQIDMKYWRNGGAFLAVYNPVGQLWHGVSRLHTVLFHLPLNYYGSLDILQKKVQVAIGGLDDSTPGVAIHAGSNVFVEPLMSTEDGIPKGLLASCPSCLSHHPVRGEKYHEKLESEDFELENLGMNFIFRYFDCDVPDIQFYIGDLLWQYDDESAQHISEGSSDYGINIIFPLRMYNYLMYFPIPGRCGFVVKATSGAKTKGVVISTQMIPDDSRNKEKERITSEYSFPEKYHLKGSIARETTSGELVQAYDFSFNYQMFRDGLDYFIKIKCGESENYSDRMKMCLDAELHYPDPPIDPLKQRDPMDEEVTGALNLVFGVVTNNKCPKRGITVKLTGRAIPVPDRSQLFYEECAFNMSLANWSPESSHLSPYTPACIKAAMDSTTLRKFEFSGEASHVIKDLASKSMYALYVLEGTDPWGIYIVNSSYSIEEFPVIKDGEGFVFEFAPDGIFLVDIIEDQERERSVYNANMASPFHSRVIRSSNPEEEEFMESTCVLTTNSITSLGLSYLPHEMSSCYTLAFGHCRTSSSLFAGLVRKIDGTKLLALKFYNLGHYVEVIPQDDNTIEVIVDGENINFKKEDGYVLDVHGKKIFRIWQRQSKKEKDGPLYLNILGGTTNLRLEYTGGLVIATMPYTFLDNVCGLCNTFNVTGWETCEHH